MQSMLCHLSFRPPLHGIRKPSRPLASSHNVNSIGLISASLAPKNDTSGTEIVKKSIVSGAISVVMACTIGVIGIGLAMNPQAVIAGPREMYQKAPQPTVYPLGGKAALQSLLDVSVRLTNPAEIELPVADFKLPSRPSMKDVEAIKTQAVRLLKHGRAEEAISMLQHACDYYSRDPEPLYNVEMTLVEVLICQGKFEEAMECNCLQENLHLPSDARLPLYKAILLTMLDEEEEAIKWWEEYTRAVDGGLLKDPRKYRM